MSFYTIHPREVESIIFRKRAVIIDIRECEEYKLYHYRGARNYPYDEMEKWIFQLRKDRTYIIYCQYGSASMMAARRMSRQGFEVYTVVGGAQALQKYSNSRNFTN